jgi:hypothetical protein
MAERSHVLIMPSDDFTSELAIKKTILFFDSVTLANAHDAALVNSEEVVEEFSGMTLTWSGRNSFPRTESYTDEMASVLRSTSSLQSRGIIRLTPPKPMPTLDPGMNYTIWHSAITSEKLVSAAAPDRFTSEKPPLGVADYMRGLIMSMGGAKSKYDVLDSRPPFEFSDRDQIWTFYAHLRLGRALKFLRISHALGLTPIAFDTPNHRILDASAEFESLVVRNQGAQRVDTVRQVHFDLDIFDREEFLKALGEMNWNEVQQLRKYVLPGMNNLRSYLRRSIQLQGRSSEVSVETYSKELTKLSAEFEGAKHKLAEEWVKLRIAAITKFGGAVGGGAAIDQLGLVGTTIGVPWVDLLVKIFAGGVIGAAAITKDLQAYIPATLAVKQHPLYFSDKYLVSR